MYNSYEYVLLNFKAFIIIFVPFVAIAIQFPFN